MERYFIVFPLFMFSVFILKSLPNYKIFTAHNVFPIYTFTRKRREKKTFKFGIYFLRQKILCIINFDFSFSPHFSAVFSLFILQIHAVLLAEKKMLSKLLVYTLLEYVITVRKICERTYFS